MGHRVPPAISRYMYKYIYICIYFFFSRSHNVEEMKKRKKTRLHARNIWFITWIIQNEIYSKRNKGHDRTSLFEFFFFFRCYHRGTFDVANVLSSRETYPYLNLTSCRWYFESGIFLNPQKYSFFFLMKILFFFFLQPRRFWLNNSFVMEIVDEMELESFFSLYIFLSLICLLIRLLKKKKKQTYLV